MMLEKEGNSPFSPARPPVSNSGLEQSNTSASGNNSSARLWSPVATAEKNSSEMSLSSSTSSTSSKTESVGGIGGGSKVAAGECSH